MASAEPQSHSDLAFCKFFRLRRDVTAGASLSEARGRGGLNPPPPPEPVEARVAEIVAHLVEVLTTTTWERRFHEIEWPVLILLCWVVKWAEAHGAPHAWPEESLPASKHRMELPKVDILIWLGWDTDKTDIDLHVHEPSGEEVYYGNRDSRSTGGHVSRDFTQGYGPETYVCCNAPDGKYKATVRYYGSHQDSPTTGSTQAVIWQVTHLGDWEKEEMQFSSVRLDEHKQGRPVVEIDFKARVKAITPRTSLSTPGCASARAFFELGLPHVTLIELRPAPISYQDHHILFALADRRARRRRRRLALPRSCSRAISSTRCPEGESARGRQGSREREAGEPREGGAWAS